MNIGILLPGFSSDENDWAIPVQLNLVRELARADDVRVLALRYPHRRDCYPVFGAAVHSLGVGQVRDIRRLLLWIDALLTLRRLHRRKPFDLFHAIWADETGLIAAWAGKLLRVPVVVSAVGGELARLDDAGYGLQRSAFSRWIVGQALMGADAVVVTCEYVRRLLSESRYTIPAARIHRVPLGVDAALFSPGDEPADPRRLVHVASLLPVKDQPTLLRALAQLNTDVTLDIIGAGPERERLQSLAESLGIRRRVRFLGDVPHPDLPRHYRQAALHVLTSRHEGQGMVTLEAAACGVPTVGAAVGILPDYPELGVSVPVGDDVTLANTIRALLDNPERRAALARSARAAVERELTIQRTVNAYRALYASLIAHP